MGSTGHFFCITFFVEKPPPANKDLLTFEAELQNTVTLEKRSRQILITALILLILSIVFGAFGAHGLQGLKLAPEKIASFETGVRYQMYNALALLALAALRPVIDFPVRIIVILVVTGVVFFSGSIYGLTLQEVFKADLSKILGPVTPFGGVLMILGWLILLVRILRMEKSKF